MGLLLSMPMFVEVLEYVPTEYFIVFAKCESTSTALFLPVISKILPFVCILQSITIVSVTFNSQKLKSIISRDTLSTTSISQHRIPGVCATAQILHRIAILNGRKLFALILSYLMQVGLCSLLLVESVFFFDLNFLLVSRLAHYRLIKTLRRSKRIAVARFPCLFIVSTCVNATLVCFVVFFKI